MNFPVELLQRVVFPLGIVLAAFISTYLSIAPIVKYAKKKKLYDLPDERKAHSTPIPALGGIAIVAGMFSAIVYLFVSDLKAESLVFIVGLLVIFIMGFIDDLILISAKKKLLIQLTVAIAIVTVGNKLPHFFGILGAFQLSDIGMAIFSVILITGLINAFNLIDGINGLAGGIGWISLFLLGIILHINHHTVYALIAFSASVSFLAFLRFNLKPTYIFMGDNGSLVLGYMIAFFSIKLLSTTSIESTISIETILKVVVAISFIPVFDALRVFTGRMLKKKSPFDPDRTHLHHLFLAKGFSHATTSIVIYLIHIVLISTAFFNDSISVGWLLALNTLVMTIWTAGLMIQWSEISLLNRKNTTPNSIKNN